MMKFKSTFCNFVLLLIFVKAVSGQVSVVNEVQDTIEFNLLKNTSTKYSREQFIDIDDYKSFRDSLFRNNYHNSLESSRQELAEVFERKTYRQIYTEWIDIDPNLIDYIYTWTKRTLEILYFVELKNLLKTDGLENYNERMAIIKENVKRILTNKGQEMDLNGFNPRPPKNRLSPHKCDYFFILGRLSNHAIGNAIDINPKRNPILDIKEWNYIEKIIGKEIDRSLAKKGDVNSLKQLWNDLNNANSNFTQHVKDQYDSLKIIYPDTHDSIIYKDFIFVEYPCLEKYKNCIFNIPWEVIKYCVIENKMTWGIAFDHVVDIHHFEFSPPTGR